MTTSDTRPLISVIMPVRNGASHIRNAIDSILKQTIRDFELIIIDDGSHDNTSDIVYEFAALDKRIRPLRQSNYGITYSLNQGLRLARGQYIARQDADDISLPNRFEVQLPWLEQHGFDMCCTRSMSLKHDRPMPRLFWLWLPRLTLLRYMNPHIHGTFLIRKDVLTSVGGYDPSFRFAQDYKLLYDLHASGKSIKYLKQPLYCTGFPEQSIKSAHGEEQRSCAQRVKNLFRDHSSTRM